MSKPTVGSHVYIQGTGKWYQGDSFGAVVVDVRDSDDTVKIRFTDGGYKRYKTADFQGLVTEAEYTPEMPEEWSTGVTSASLDQSKSEMTGLHDDIMSAVKAGDFLRANELQQKFTSLVAKYDQVHALEVKLIDLVNKGDYLKAHDVQEEIRGLTGRKTVSAGTPSSTLSAIEIMNTAAWRALGGGLAGASAMVLQVSTLMWLRTTMNFQYRHGTSTGEAMRTLYAEGGIPRFYRGIGAAILQGPILRFGDTAGNAGVLAAFEHTSAKDWPVFVKTVFGSASAATIRIALMPVDTIKTMLQVEGKEGLARLGAKYKSHGLPVFFHGSIATSAATFVGHYPWFTIFNTLQSTLPEYSERTKKLARNAAIGFGASVTSDSLANSLRVLKTVRQTNDTMPYSQIVRQVIEQDGVVGFLGRGLKTRILANGCQGVLFSVLYKLFEEKFTRR